MNPGRRMPSLLAVSLLACLSAVVLGASPAPPPGLEMPAKLPKLKGPVLTTTCGQSPGSVMVRMLCKQQGLACDEEILFTAADLQESVKTKGYKTLIVTMGTSLKGMGAAGVEIDEECKRVGALIAAARKLGIFVIGAQIEGASRRTDQTDEMSNKTVAPNSDLLVVMKEVNGDGFFSNTAKQKGIPIIFIQKSLDFGYVLSVLFET